MSDFIRIATEAELPVTNEVREFACADKSVCVANVDGVFYAMDNVCLHRGGPLGEGTIEDGKVVCPWHGWRWDPKTGQAEQSASARVAVYPVKVDNGEVVLEIMAGKENA